MDTTMDANQNVASIAIVPGQLYHVLLPRNSRNTMEVSFPNKMLVPDITEVIKSALQDTYKTSNILILKAEYLKHYFNEETLSNSYTYAIIYLNIHVSIYTLHIRPLMNFRTYWMIFSKTYSCISTSFKKEISLLSHTPKKLQGWQFSQNCLSEKALKVFFF